VGTAEGCLRRGSPQYFWLLQGRGKSTIVKYAQSLLCKKVYSAGEKTA